MRHVSEELRINRVLSKSVAAPSIRRVTHESVAIDTKVDFVAVAVPVVVWVVVQLAQSAIVEEELPQRHANQHRVKPIVVLLMVESVAAALEAHGYEPFSLAVLEVHFLARPHPDK